LSSLLRRKSLGCETGVDPSLVPRNHRVDKVSYYRALLDYGVFFSCRFIFKFFFSDHVSNEQSAAWALAPLAGWFHSRRLISWLNAPACRQGGFVQRKNGSPAHLMIVQNRGRCLWIQSQYVTVFFREKRDASNLSLRSRWQRHCARTRRDIRRDFTKPSDIVVKGLSRVLHPRGFCVARVN